jgi:hypothetical protein
MGSSEQKSEEKKFSGLRQFNTLMGVIHLAQGLLILALSNNFSLPVTSSFIEFNQATQTLGPVTQTLFTLPIAPMIAIFLFLSAADHFLLSAPGIFPWYIENLRKHINYARWYEYALSSSVMIVVISMFVGVYDIASLIAIFCINACMNLFGLMMELHNQTTEKTNWTAYYFGTFAGLIPWVCITVYLWGAASVATNNIPTFVYFIYLTIAITFFSFAFNMILQYKKVGKWKDYLYGERGYIILSLVAKTALAWQVFAGTLRPPS